MPVPAWLIQPESWTVPNARYSAGDNAVSVLDPDFGLAVLNGLYSQVCDDGGVVLLKVCSIVYIFLNMYLYMTVSNLSKLFPACLFY